MGTLLLHCNWETHGRYAYFANLKVMRRVLLVVRGVLEERGALLGAYLFFDDRIRFLAEGPEDGLSQALAVARAATAQDFADSDSKPLWGGSQTVALSGEARAAELGRMMREPVTAGLVSVPAEYPWCGGPWLLEQL